MRGERLSTIKRLVIAALAVVLLASGFYFARQSGTDPDAYRNDFGVYYHAASEIIAGRDPYQHSLGDWTPYIYPPLLAELIIPLALLPLPAAAYLWFLISAASTIAAAWMSAGLASGSHERGLPELHDTDEWVWRAAVAGCAIVVVLRFALDTFNLGQVNAIVAALAVAHVFFYARDRKALSAIALVIAVSIKLTPALLLVYHIAKLRLKFAIACAALIGAVTALSVLPFSARGPAALQTFWDRTIKNEQGYDFSYSGNQSLRGAIARLTQRAYGPADEGEKRRPADRLTLLVSVVLLGFAGFAAVRARSELPAAAPFFCCMVLLSPLSWKAHYVVLILPVAYLIFLAKIRVKRRLLIASTLVVTFVLLNLTSPHLIGTAAAEWADAHSLVFGGALLIFIACAASSWLPEKG